ncbi:MAG TPA: amidohydrolase family protein [Dehalococcoidia bacterium]|nr:amidohydrolase family protein [Dehalococcoidia bacterium]
MHPAPAVLIAGARVFDSDAGTLISGLDVRIDGGQIVALGRGLPRDGVQVVEAGGKALLPGLIDCHVHLAYDGRPGEPIDPVDPFPVYAWRMANNARATLRAGFTTVRDLGAPQAINCDLMRAVSAGLVEGPRIVPAGRMITMTGGHGWPIGREADGADEVRKAVREQLKAGARAIKLMASGGVMTPGVDPRSPQLGLDELSAGVEEAHKAGVKTASHAQAAAGIRNAVFAGIDSIEHGIYLEDDVIEEMKRRGTALVATLAAPHNINALGEGAGMPPHVLEKSRMVAEAHLDSFRRAMRAGVTLASGTDAGTPGNQHGRNAQELRLMVEHGLSPAEAIRAATTHAAALLGLADQTGRIAPGFAADLLLVSGDPLADIAVLERPEAIAAVWLEGRRPV